MSASFQSNKRAFLADLVGLAREYGWQGDYVEVKNFITWVHEELDEDISEDELEPFADDSNWDWTEDFQ